MKKLQSVLLVLLSILTFNLIGCKKSGTENVEKKFLNNECVEYFYNIDNDYPINSFGSCGYVAIASILRYYDYKYDDSIVDNKYEENNGLKHGEKEDIESLDTYGYYDFLLNTVDDYLQSFLIVEANKKFNIYNPKNKYPTEMGYGSYCHIQGYYTEVQAVLDYYLYDVKGFSKQVIETKRIKDDVRNTITNEIKSGNPVIVSCKGKKSRGHIFIIYDYDEKTDEIYGNSLTMERYNHMRISSAYKKIEYAIVLKYNN